MTQTEQPPLVTAEHGPRPAGSPIECFHCGRQIGQTHKADCVQWTRQVRLRLTTSAGTATMTIEWDADVPHSWNEADILFRYNESTWCTSNAVDLFDGGGPGFDVCLCDTGFKVEIVESVTR